MLQFLLGLSDRQAAEEVRCRIDFKYALAMELDDPGFHHSVLADFRDRLTEDGRADRLLDLALARLKKAGLVRERTTQRTDSTHVLAAVRDLTRLELITEAEGPPTPGHPEAQTTFLPGTETFSPPRPGTLSRSPHIQEPRYPLCPYSPDRRRAPCATQPHGRLGPARYGRPVGQCHIRT
ncbi:transposase [Streptomyces sp. NPDC059426]|uniref:transposase n=1 Tax=Streptomyces sp. NPDC059426 TaxID=3346827 RepID=UPI0036B2D80F